MTLPDDSFKNDSLSQLMQLRTGRDRLVDEIAELEATLKDKKANLRNIEWNLLPQFMEENDFTRHDFSDGTTLSINTVYSGKMSDAAYDWLKENNCEGIVKDEVSLSLPKGEGSMADTAMKVLEEAGLMPSRKQAVHPSTLKSFIKERCESGDGFPRDIFSVYEGKQAKFKK